MKYIRNIFNLIIILYFLFIGKVYAAPTVSNLSILTPDNLGQYDKYEISFEVINSAYDNPYFPYDNNTPSGILPGRGINAIMQILLPGQSDWLLAKKNNCFFFQPYIELGTNQNIDISLSGKPQWRCRYTPQQSGLYNFRIFLEDKSGSSLSEIKTFNVLTSSNKGFIRVSSRDYRFFEFDNGKPFITPLVNVEEGSPFGSLYNIKNNIAKLGQYKINFLRWVPSAEGSNYYIVPYSDNITSSWAFGGAYISVDNTDLVSGNKFSFSPYFYSGQNIPVIPGSKYRYKFRAKITGDQVLRPLAGTYISAGVNDICSATSTHHESLGYNCKYKNNGWNEYVFEFTNTSNEFLYINLSALYFSSDAPSPFNIVKNGKISINSISLQKEEGGTNLWGPNLISRGDPDTYRYIDQLNAARLDELIKYSEQAGVYHKLTLFHKNDAVLGRLLADGSFTSTFDINNFYASDNLPARWYEKAYVRYFISRWGYSTIIHSLELANENNFDDRAKNAAFAISKYIAEISTRKIVQTNSFWGYWISDFWTNPTYGYLMDYADKHWYANQSGEDCYSTNKCELISNQWQDSAAYTRECHNRFLEYATSSNYKKPIVRGEGGVAVLQTQPQNENIANETTGTYYHKKIWSHLGILGYTCDGEWYPRLFVNDNKAFPNVDNNLYKIFSAYEKFTNGETLNSGNFVEIGDDLAGENQIIINATSGRLRSWGSKDKINNKVLLWVDNANHTWKNVYDKINIPPASGTVKIQGMTSGIYQGQWWDTKTAEIIKTENYTVSGDKILTINIVNLYQDAALKIVDINSITPTPTITQNLLPKFGWNKIIGNDPNLISKLPSNCLILSTKKIKWYDHVSTYSYNKLVNSNLLILCR